MSSLRIGIVSSQWNRLIVDRLLDSAMATLRDAGISDQQIVHFEVPGAYEVPQGCKAIIDTTQVDAIVTIGCVIRGETPHFDYVAGECARGVTDLALLTGVPITLGVLTCDNGEQALARAGGDKGNKGAEATEAALQMITAIKSMRES